MVLLIYNYILSAYSHFVVTSEKENIFSPYQARKSCSNSARLLTFQNFYTFVFYILRIRKIKMYSPKPLKQLQASNKSHLKICLKFISVYRQYEANRVIISITVDWTTRCASFPNVTYVQLFKVLFNSTRI